MTSASRKRIAIVFLALTILWFACLVSFETHYVISVLRQSSGFRDLLGTIYEEQIEGINFILVVVYLLPGVFLWAVYRRFKREY